MRFLLGVFFLFWSVTAAPFLKRSIPLLPSDDSFYTPPSGYESMPVGAIINSRQMTNPFLNSIDVNKVKGIYQLLVRSEDSSGNANAIVTTLFVPKNGDGNKLLSYQIAEDSAYINSAISYNLQANTNATSQYDTEEILIQGAINKGWYVVVPDHQGPKSAFGAGIQAGRATLNSVRACLKSGNKYGIKSSAKVAYWGYSGGSIATGWAGLLEPSYAPEMKKNTVGYAMGGIVANITNVALHNMGGGGAGLIFAAISGLSAEYSEVNDFVNANVFPDKLDDIKYISSHTETDVLGKFSNKGWTDYFTTGNDTLLQPAIHDVCVANSMTDSKLVPTAPMFFYNTQKDEVIPPADTDVLYKRLCAAGASIQYDQDLIGEHVLESLFGAGDAFVWLQQRFLGIPQWGCHKSFSVSNALTIGGAVGNGELFAGPIFNTLVAKITGLIF